MFGKEIRVKSYNVHPPQGEGINTAKHFDSLAFAPLGAIMVSKGGGYYENRSYI